MQINTNGMNIEWNGSHTANVWRFGSEVDVFTFAWEKNNPTAIDFLSAAIQYLEDENVSS